MNDRTSGIGSERFRGPGGLTPGVRGGLPEKVTCGQTSEGDGASPAGFHRKSVQVKAPPVPR